MSSTTQISYIMRAFTDSQGNSPCIGSERQCSTLTRMLKSRNPSVLLLGPRGAGKATALSSVLKKFDFHLIKVDGVLLSGNDSSALASIISQLPDELLDTAPTASFVDNIAILQRIVSDRRLTKDILIFVDEIQDFAYTKAGRVKSKQSLLYNLFDLQQHPSARLAVVGSTPRLDITGMLEKRILSRFSNRKVLFDPLIDYDTLLKVLVSKLDLAELSSVVLKNARSRLIDTMRARRSLLDLQLSRGKPISWFLELFKDMLLSPECTTRDIFSLDAFDASFREFCNAPYLNLLSECSTLELTLLSGMVRLYKKGSETFNLAMICEEYKTLEMQCSETVAVYSRTNFITVWSRQFLY